ncbi:hypothetical protein ACOSQ3_023911 [Xanthoceras sorbifolium]
MTPPAPVVCEKPTVVSGSTPQKRKKKKDSSGEGKDQVSLSFPSGASAYSDIGAIMPQVLHLLLHKDASCLKEMGSRQWIGGSATPSRPFKLKCYED